MAKAHILPFLLFSFYLSNAEDESHPQEIRSLCSLRVCFVTLLMSLCDLDLFSASQNFLSFFKPEIPGILDNIGVE